MCFVSVLEGDGAGQAFVKKYVEQPGLPEHARYSKAKDMIEKKVRDAVRGWETGRLGGLPVGSTFSGQLAD